MSEEINLTKRYYARIHETGFSIWDRKECKWIIDASEIELTDQLDVSMKMRTSGLLNKKRWNYPNQAKFKR